jgi:pentatricopeptide repeat protein
MISPSDKCGIIDDTPGRQRPVLSVRREGSVRYCQCAGKAASGIVSAPEVSFIYNCIIINAFCKNRNTAAAKAFFHGVKILRLHKEICYK